MSMIKNMMEVIADGVQYAQSLAPIAIKTGGPIVGKAFDAVSSVTEIAEDFKKRLADEKIALSTTDEKRLQEMLDGLSLEADKLAKLVDAS